MSAERVVRFVDHAYRYAELGWALIPLDGKVPKPKEWETTKPDAPELAAGKWSQWGERWNMGVVLGTSGLAVVEYDTEPAAQKLRELLGGSRPRTPTARTGRGRLHLYFRDPDAPAAKRDGLELRAGGQQCAAPPSVHPDTGVAYEWLEGLEPWSVELAPVPQAVLDYFAEQRSNGPAPPVGEEIPEGGRHAALLSLAGTMRDRGMSGNEILAALRAVNAERCRPPMPDEEVQELAYDVAARYPPGRSRTPRVAETAPDQGLEVVDGDGSQTSPADRFESTDLGNARHFAAEHGQRFRYVVARRRWLVWRDGRWRLDEDDAAVRAAKATAETMLRRAVELEEPERKAAIKHALASQSEPALRRMLTLAGSEPGLALTPDRLDADAYALSCANGTLDLRTGELRPHEPEDLISLGNDIAYNGHGCPRWERFLLEIFDGDEDLVAFVRRAVGYSLTGETSEHVVFIAHGAGWNGKTTFLETVKRLLGGLAATSPFDTFVRTRDGRSPRNDLARLHRARLVAAAESGEGRRLDEAVVKGLTGGDTVTARFLYGEHFEFRPHFKIWLATNHRPKVDGGDDAIWRRIRLIPFDVSFRGRVDQELPRTLERELPGILDWAVQGCLEWQREGLGEATAVTRATTEYREEEDTLGAFLAERCELDPTASTDPAEFREAYEQFCKELGEKPESASVLGKQLARRRIRRSENRPRRYLGVRLTAQEAESAGQSANPHGESVCGDSQPGSVQQTQECVKVSRARTGEEVSHIAGPAGLAGQIGPDDPWPEELF